MCIMLILFLTILNLCLNPLFCIKEPVKEIVVGQRLIDALISTKTSVDFISYVRYCLSRRNCGSVNYMVRFTLCELNYKNTTELNHIITTSCGYVYSERIHWRGNKILSKSCRLRPCSNNTECIENQSKESSCVVSDCGQPDVTENATYHLSNGIGLYSKVTYECGTGYYKKGRSYIGCQGDGKWSPVTFKCFPVCETVWEHFDLSCYWIPEEKKSFEEAKIHCNKEGAILAHVLSEKENDFIWKLKSNIEDNQLLLFGGKYNNIDQQWKWIDTDLAFYGNRKESMLYTNWDIAEPTNHYSECMGMFYNSKKWQDWYCSWITHFICKKSAQA